MNVSTSSPRRGRRSLNGVGDSPQLRLRLPAELLEALSRRAAQEGLTVSELSRRVLTDAVYQPPGRVSVEPSRKPLTGPLGRRLRGRRRSVLDAAAVHGLTNVRVFGSVARGEDRPDSDVDLLVDIPPGMGLIGLGRARADLERILEARVDLIPSSDLKDDVAVSAGAELVSL